MSPSFVPKGFRYGVPGKGGIKKLLQKLLSCKCLPSGRHFSSGRLLRSRFVRDSVADRPIRPGRRNGSEDGVSTCLSHASLRSPLVSKSYSYSFSHALLRTDSRRPTAQRCMFSFCRYSSRYRGCASTGLVTSHLFFLRSSAQRERWLACRLSHLQRRQSLFWWRSLTG